MDEQNVHPATNPIHFVAFYHANCMDGTYAAAIAARMLGPWDAQGAVSTVPITYGQDVLGQVEDLDPEEHHLLFLDFSPEEDVFEKLKGWIRLGKMLIVDHHKSRRYLAQHAHPDFPDALRPSGVVYNPMRCGAFLTWGALSGTYDEERAPLLVRYVQDRDLWKWKLPFSAEVNAALRVRGFSPQAHEFLFDDAAEVPRLIGEGRLVLMANQMVVDAIIPRARKVAFEGLDIEGWATPIVAVAVMNPVYYMASMICDQLLEKRTAPIALSYVFEPRDELFHVDIRSNAGGPCVREIAQAYGGGGHDNAAGFRCEVLPFRNITPEVEDELDGQKRKALIAKLLDEQLPQAEGEGIKDYTRRREQAIARFRLDKMAISQLQGVQLDRL